MEKLVFCSVFIYLFVYYFFIQRLFLCLFFIYSNIAACWVMHLLFGLAPFGAGAVVTISVELCGVLVGYI